MGRYEQKESKSILPIVIIIVVIIGAILAFWFYPKEETVVKQNNKILPLPAEQVVVDVEDTIVPIVDEHVAVLDETADRQEDKKNEASNVTDGALEQSTKVHVVKKADDFSHDVTTVSKNLSTWFTVKQPIKKYMLIVNDLSQKQLIYKHVSFLKMSQKMVIDEDSQGLHMNRASYRRYDALANSVVAIDVKKGLDLYLTFKPFFSPIYDSFSYPDKYSLEDMFVKAAANVIKAPVIERRIFLRKHATRYKFADKELESLDAIDKQMLRRLSLG